MSLVEHKKTNKKVKLLVGHHLEMLLEKLEEKDMFYVEVGMTMFLMTETERLKLIEALQKIGE